MKAPRASLFGDSGIAHRSTRQPAIRATLAALLVITLFPQPALAANESVSITSTLTPRDLTIAVGDAVTWTNNDGERHRIRTTSGPVEFDSGNLDSGETFSFTFDIAGTYLYMDDRDRDNASYYGTVVVTQDDPGDPGVPPPPSGDVRIINDTFQPGSITINVGGTVTWANQDREHTVTARDRSWDSGIFDAGQTYSRTFTSPGTVEYFCIIHPDMVGTVVVVGDGGEPPPPPPPPPPPAPPPPPDPGSSGVLIIDNDFNPASTTVTVGSTVSWVNTGALPHTATAAGMFDSGILMSGDSWSRTFTSAGTYDYICTLHPEMIGTITVTGDSGDPPPPGEDPPPPPPPGEDPPPPPPGEEPPPQPPSGAISIVDNDYQPRTRTVTVGSTVSWVNNGQLPHTVTAAGQFDSGFLMNGDSWSRTFNSAGAFHYTCTIHPEMTGTIIVTGSGGEPPPTGEDPMAGDDPVPPDAEPPPQPPSGAISMIDNDYQPRTRTVTVGSTVSWVNNGQLPHTVTAAGQFDSGILMNGDSWSRTFNSAGTFDYVCTLHPEMKGTIIVTGSGGEVPSSQSEETDSLFEVEDPSADQGELSDVALPASLAVDMIDNAYDPAAIEVRVGDSITWVNKGELPHTVTARNESFDSGFLMSGESWAMRFDQVGTIEYFCIIHPEMVGTISVVETVDSDGAQPVTDGEPLTADPEPDQLTQSAAAGVSGSSGATEAAIAVILFLVLLTVGLIVFVSHEVDFAPAPPGDASPGDGSG